jgi:hypothetical protein
MFPELVYEAVITGFYRGADGSKVVYLKRKSADRCRCNLSGLPGK